MTFDITPKELKARMDAGEEILILDVREPFERDLAQIGGVSIPLGQLTERHPELDSESEIFVLCHHGVRSAQAAGFLRSVGFKKVVNIRGGIDRWSMEADPSVPKY